jgi:hypothetical protein
MSSDAILDLTAAVVVFGSALVVARWEAISTRIRKALGRPKDVTVSSKSM